MTAISCPSERLCIALDNQGNVAESNDPLAGSPWTILRWVIPYEAHASPGTGVACPSTSFCAAVGNSGLDKLNLSSPPGYVATTTDPGSGNPDTWTTTTLGGNVAPLSVSCPSSTLCVLGDLEGDLISSTNPAGGASAWSVAPVADRSISSISCVSANLCVAVDGFDPESGDAYLGGGDVLVSTNPTGGSSAWKVIHVGPSALASVSCPTVTFCAALDTSGNAFVSTNPTGGATDWTEAHIADSVPANTPVGVSCPSAQLCVAVEGPSAIIGMPSQSSPPPPPSPPPAVTVAEIRDLLRQELLQAHRTRIGGLLRHRRYISSVRGLTAGRLTISWYARPTRQRSRPAPWIRIATGSTRFSAKGTARLTIRLTRRGSRLLGHARRVRIMAQGSFIPTGKGPVRASETFVLSR